MTLPTKQHPQNIFPDFNAHPFRTQNSLTLQAFSHHNIIQNMEKLYNMVTTYHCLLPSIFYQIIILVVFSLCLPDPTLTSIKLDQYREFHSMQIPQKMLACRLYMNQTGSLVHVQTHSIMQPQLKACSQMSIRLQNSPVS